jgi:hypothetical protein
MGGRSLGIEGVQVETEHLVVGLAPGNESGTDESPTGFAEFVERVREKGGQAVIRAIAQAPGVGGGNEHEVEGQGLGAGGKVIVAKQAVVDPAEAARGVPETIRIGNIGGAIGSFWIHGMDLLLRGAGYLCDKPHNQRELWQEEISLRKFGLFGPIFLMMRLLRR